MISDYLIPSSQRRLALLAVRSPFKAVVIHGPGGTGKQVMGHWIHNNSTRTKHDIGLASLDRPLNIQLAENQGGTLLIPNLSRWSKSEQQIVLRCINTKTIPLPGSNEIPLIVHLRIIITTKHPLEEWLIKKENFFQIEMQPLSERSSEFEDIVHGIFLEIVRSVDRPQLRTISRSVLDQLRSHDWPGNLKELYEVLEAAVSQTKLDENELSQLPDSYYRGIRLVAGCSLDRCKTLPGRFLSDNR